MGGAVKQVRELGGGYLTIAAGRYAQAITITGFARVSMANTNTILTLNLIRRVAATESSRWMVNRHPLRQGPCPRLRGHVIV